ncbi:hypothetical protein [Erwinia psidii]|uniref:hypothetical protein n=1 Tax=Erwinia psidii TaxID=69224 RepID=UPI00226B6FF1|nr:hypothetical protein [Erwinia psidii]
MLIKLTLTQRSERYGPLPQCRLLKMPLLQPTQKAGFVYRDVVKYVNNPLRNVCEFDPDAVQLRQRAIDAANHIPRFDAATVPDK